MIHTPDCDRIVPLYIVTFDAVGSVVLDAEPAIAKVVAVAELPVQLPDDPEQLPVIDALIVAGNTSVASAEPSTETPVDSTFVPSLS